MSTRGRPSQFRRRAITLLRMLDQRFGGQAELRELVRDAAIALDVSERTIYRDIARLMTGSSFLGPLRTRPIAMTRGRRNIVYLSRRLVGFELIATLLATTMASCGAIIALLARMWYDAIQIGASMLLFAGIISSRYFHYLRVRRDYHLDGIQA